MGANGSKAYCILGFRVPTTSVGGRGKGAKGSKGGQRERRGVKGSKGERRVCGVFNKISRDLSMKRDVRESSLKTPQTLRSPSLPFAPFEPPGETFTTWYFLFYHLRCAVNIQHLIILWILGKCNSLIPADSNVADSSTTPVIVIICCTKRLKPPKNRLWPFLIAHTTNCWMWFHNNGIIQLERLETADTKDCSFLCPGTSCETRWRAKSLQ